MTKHSVPTFIVGAATLTATALLPGCINKAMVGNENTVQGTVQVCSSCHGPEGRNSNSTFPVLAGQQHDYLVAELKSFRNRTRAERDARTYMWGMAAKLTDPMIDGVARYYSSQALAQPAEQDPALVNAGRVLFAQGVTASDIPACAACHGDAAGGNDAIPRLAGQHRHYLQEQLHAFQVNSRANETMRENSKNLAPQQIDEVTAYLASLK